MMKTLCWLDDTALNLHHQPVILIITIVIANIHLKNLPVNAISNHWFKIRLYVDVLNISDYIHTAVKTLFDFE